jgi:hypothetical protein
MPSILYKRVALSSEPRRIYHKSKSRETKYSRDKRAAEMKKLAQQLTVWLALIIILCALHVLPVQGSTPYTNQLKPRIHLR